MPHYNSPQKKSGTPVFLILAIIGLIVFVGLVALVGGGIYLVSKVRNDSDTVKTIRGTERGCPCSVEVPSNWANFPAGDRNPDATIQQAHLFGERYVMVISDTKSDIASVFGVEDASGAEVLKQFADLSLQGVEESFTVDRISNRKLSVNGLPAIQHKFKARADGIDMVFWTTYVEGKDHFFQIQTWTLAGLEAQNEKGLLKVADSFKEN